MNELAFCNKRIDIVYLSETFEDCMLSSKKHTTHFMRLLEEINFEFYTFLKIVKIILKKKVYRDRCWQQGGMCMREIVLQKELCT